MKTDRLGTILFLVVMFSIASSLPGYALEPPPTLETALAGTVPIVFSPRPAPAVTYKLYIFPGSPDTFFAHDLNRAPYLGFRGVITRMTVFQKPIHSRQIYTLYVNGKPTQLTCFDDRAGTNTNNGCSANWNVPIDVKDQICVELGGTLGGITSPTITLMVRMGGK